MAENISWIPSEHTKKLSRENIFTFLARAERAENVRMYSPKTNGIRRNLTHKLYLAITAVAIKETKLWQNKDWRNSRPAGSQITFLTPPDLML